MEKLEFNFTTEYNFIIDENDLSLIEHNIYRSFINSLQNDCIPDEIYDFVPVEIKKEIFSKVVEEMLEDKENYWWDNGE